ncbi:DUF6907 domain-containing protein [Streptomyces brevispora]|uniref:DUF6907 domain-containing protein n=1 Tax=Streptomyces brevispora TaxID=887462 RepID=UPI0035DEB18A
MRHTASAPTTVPASFKPSGGIVAQPTGEPVMTSPTANDDLVAIWRSMTVGETANAPVGQLLKLLGVRLVEVEAGELAADGIVGYFSGRIGEGEIQIERTLPQADRESVVRELLARITPTQQSYTKRTLTAPRLRPAVVGGKPIHIECADWCDLDHVYESQGHLVDVYHSGVSVDLMGPRMGEVPQPLLHARLHADTFGTDTARQAPYIVVDDESDDFHMTPAQALEFADDLVAFADKVRALAAQAGR